MSKNIQEATKELKDLLIGREILTIRHAAIPVLFFSNDVRIALRQWDEYAPTKFNRCEEITDLRIDVDDNIYRIIVDTTSGETITLLQVHASGFDLRVFDDSLDRNYTIEVSTKENTNTKKYAIIEDDCKRASYMTDTIIYRVRALKDFGNVLKGDLGGFIMKLVLMVMLKLKTTQLYLIMLG